MNLPPCEMWARVGSFHMGDPNWKDVDFLFLSKDMGATSKWFDKHGWTPCTEKDYLDNFKAWRKGDKNTIVVRTDSEFFGFMAAYHLCRQYKIFNKSHRVLIHESIRKRSFVPCDFTVDNRTREFKIGNCFASDKDKQAQYDDGEPPY